MSYDSYSAKVQKAIGFAEISALKRVEGLMKNRIHNRGQNSEDTSIGTYSVGWAKKRKAKGRQVAYVDLQVEGNLIRGYSVGIFEGQNALGFTSELYPLIREKQEENYGSIFNLTPTEKEQMNKAFMTELKIQLNVT